MNKIKFNIYLVVLVVSFLLLTVKASAIEPGSTTNPGGTNYGSCVDYTLCSSRSYPYGYRVYVMDDAGNIKAVSNVINSNISGYNIFSGTKVRKQVVTTGNSNLTTAENVVSNSLFSQFLHTGTEPNFDAVFKNALRLIQRTGAGDYCVSENGSCLDMNINANIQKMISYLNSFLSSVGINSITAEYLYSLWAANRSSNLYLAAEPIGSFYNKVDKVYVAGTCTELTKYAKEKDVENSQRRVLLDLCSSAVLDKYNAAGYYLVSGDISTGTLTYGNDLFNRISLGNIKAGNVEGISVLMWRMNDFFGNNPDNPNNPNIPGETPGTCSYKLKVNVPKTCSGTNSGVVTDETSWNCILNSSKSTNNANVQDQHVFNAFSNDYCKIYCSQTIDIVLPTTGGIAKAGTYFVLGSISGTKTIGPVQYKSTTVCRPTTFTNGGDPTGNINIAKFISDYQAKDAAVLAAYDAWQFGELQNQVIRDGNSRPLTYRQTCKFDWCDKYKEYDCGTTKEPNKKCTDYSVCVDDPPTSTQCSMYREGTYYKYNNVDYYGATDAYKVKNTNIGETSCHCTAWSKTCEQKCDGPRSIIDTSTLKNNYTRAINERNLVLENLKKCNNFYRTLKEFEPSVTIQYQDELYNKTYNLKSNSYTSSRTDYFNVGNANDSIPYSNISTSINTIDKLSTNTYATDTSSNRGKTSVINYYDCGYSVTKTKCSAVSQAVYPSNTWFEQTTEKTVNYTLPDGINKYVLKPSGLSIDSLSSSQLSSNYDVIPFGNLPIHYSTSTGSYPFTITTNNFGSDSKFNRYLGSGASYNGTTYVASNKYGCQFAVTPGPIEKTKFLVRSISLIYPFPGQNGTEINLRDPKTNWKEYYGLDPVSQYIYNNRGVKYYDVYNLDPMYEVTLTPALMRKIKEYNSVQNKKREIYYEGTDKEVNAVLGYSDFTLTCKTESDNSKSRNCISQIIRDWGVKGCAIKNSGYTNCGTTVAR